MKLLNSYITDHKHNNFLTRLWSDVQPISKNLWYRLICVLGLGVIALSPIAGSIFLQIVGIILIGIGSFSLLKLLSKRKIEKQTKPTHITQLRHTELEKLYKKPTCKKETMEKTLGITTPLPQNTKTKLLNITTLLNQISPKQAIDSPKEEEQV